jgi:tetratricopeptide (TPR) repeat protein
MFSRAENRFRQALEREPNRSRSHVRLGDALMWQGQFSAALKAYRRGDELGRKEPRWTAYLGGRIQEAEELVAVEARMAAGLKEGVGSSNLPLLTVAQMYVYKGHYAAASRFFVQAFTAQPKLAEESGTGRRYNAACVALLASCGQGEDAARLDGQERTRWRRQALEWLHGDLKHWTRQFAGAAPRDRIAIQQKLRHWQKDADLAAVRDPDALRKLPEAEQVAWGNLWAQVAALLSRTSPGK